MHWSAGHSSSDIAIIIWPYHIFRFNDLVSKTRDLSTVLLSLETFNSWLIQLPIYIYVRRILKWRYGFVHNCIFQISRIIGAHHDKKLQKEVNQMLKLYTPGKGMLVKQIYANDTLCMYGKLKKNLHIFSYIYLQHLFNTIYII